MGKFVKPGKVVLVLVGGYSGHKAVIMKNIDDDTSDPPYSHALVAGIDHYPCKVTASMSKKNIAKRSKNKSFVKVYNYNHLMPTRYSVDIPLDKTVINQDVFTDTALKPKAHREAKAEFEERYKTGKNKWLFQMFQLLISGKWSDTQHHWLTIQLADSDLLDSGQQLSNLCSAVKGLEVEASSLVLSVPP
ncbi:60S ribosomal protein L27-like [Sciurus carolinensis]|uniref:60S ribosomal protein L27-like n=1 Tax=Sciurus carolinensis TaxID=30640 RepID=UPI001FB44447|nr:60S ribosomal protein L27-like [Sciurus carolinensis]